MDPVLFAIELLGAGLCFTEGTIIYFVLRLRQNSRRLEDVFIPDQINKVLAEVNPEVVAAKINEAVPIVVDQSVEKFKAYLVGAGGEALRVADSGAGKAFMDELAALDWGSPVANGLWTVLVRSQGARIVPRLGRVVRRVATMTGSKYANAITAEFALPGEAGSEELP